MAAELFQHWWSNNPSVTVQELIQTVAEDGLRGYNDLLVSVLQEFHDEAQNNAGFDYHKESSTLLKRVNQELQKLENIQK